MTNSKLYVDNLTFNTSEKNLREIFSEAGEARETAIITDKTTDQSRGFAFVTMADEAEAKLSYARSQEEPTRLRSHFGAGWLLKIGHYRFDFLLNPPAVDAQLAIVELSCLRSNV